jgi:hypothetical protein
MRGESRGATVLHSVFNVINLFMGVGLLSLPYAMRLGGWSAAVALVVVTVLFGFSGHLIVAGFQKVIVCAPTHPPLSPIVDPAQTFDRGPEPTGETTHICRLLGLSLIAVGRSFRYSVTI